MSLLGECLSKNTARLDRLLLNGLSATIWKHPQDEAKA